MTRKSSKPAKRPVKKPAKAKKPTRRAAKPASATAKKAKKPEKPLISKKAAAPAPKLKPGKAAAPRGAPAKVAKAVKPAGATAKELKAAAAAAKKRALVVPTGVAKPGLGHKWSCFNCGTKFYDLGKPAPVCPKCEADQRDRPPVVADAAPSPPQPKRPTMAPMSRFLDDDEVAAPEPDEFGGAPAEADVDEPEAAEIDIESLDEPAALGTETDFSEPEEE
jgi:hypothetical protein